MKKFVSVLLCLLIVCMSVASFAEGADNKEKIGSITVNGAFDLRGRLPEGYHVQPRKIDQTQVIAWIVSDDPSKPVLQLSIAFDEAYADVDRMNDLDDATFEELEKSFTDVDPTIDITYGDTGLGTRLLIARQSNEEYNYIDFFSIYKGYMIEFVIVPSETATDKTLSDEQYNMCIDFLTDLDFVPVDGAVAEGEAEAAEEDLLSEND